MNYIFGHNDHDKECPTWYPIEYGSYCYRHTGPLVYSYRCGNSTEEIEAYNLSGTTCISKVASNHESSYICPSGYVYRNYTCWYAVDAKFTCK